MSHSRLRRLTPRESALHRLAGRKDSVVVVLQHDDLGSCPPRSAERIVEVEGGGLEVLGGITIDGEEGVELVPDLLAGSVVAGRSEEDPPQALVVPIGQLALAGRPGRQSRIAVVQSELAKGQGRVGDGVPDDVGKASGRCPWVGIDSEGSASDEPQCRSQPRQALQQRSPIGTASSRS